MPDRLTTALDSLEALAPSLTWADVVERAEGATDDQLPAFPDGSPHGSSPRRRRVLSLVAAVGTLAVVAGVVAASRDPVDRSEIITKSGASESPSTSTPTTSPTATVTVPSAPASTRPAVGSVWHAAVNAWTGSEYLVWGGQVGGDGSGRADGWRYDPGTGASRDIPVAPIAPRDSAAGVWTGTELVVCCGTPLLPGGAAYSTASAAAFDPSTSTWRRLADPPAGSGGHALGAVWTGTAMLVVTRVDVPARTSAGDPLALFAYEPALDRWTTLTAPPRGGRAMGEVAWTGEKLVLWIHGEVNPDSGAVYDPATDSWMDLPAQPDALPVISGSIAYLDGELIIWGIDARDQTRSAGYRMRLGDTAWRPIAAAPLPTIKTYEGTRGSQALVVDEARSRVLVWPITGYESGAGGTQTPPPFLYAYSPRTNTWTKLDQLPGAWYAPDLLLAPNTLLRPDRRDPVVLRIDN